MTNKRDPIEIRTRWMIELQRAGWSNEEVLEIMSRSELPPEGPVPIKPGSPPFFVPLRARPFVPPRPEAGALVEPTQAATRKEKERPVPAERGRGRPPKAREEKIVSGMEASSESRAQAREIAASPKRGRGRPPKARSDESVLEIVAEPRRGEERTDVVAPVKRGRGRPPKVRETEPVVETVAAPRRRAGRPPKSREEASSSFESLSAELGRALEELARATRRVEEVARRLNRPEGRDRA